MTNRSASDWLLNGDAPPRKKAKAKPAAKKSPRKTKPRSSPTAWLLEGEQAETKVREEGHRAKPTRGRAKPVKSRGRKSSTKLVAREQKIGKLEARIEELETELESKPYVSPSANGRRSSRGKRDLNSVSFEELREIGLSVTQCARVIAYRDVRGGFESIEEIDELPGLPRETRELMRKRLKG